MQVLNRLAALANGSGADTTAKLAAAAPTAVSVLLVVALAAQFAAVVWRVVAPAEQAMSVEGQVAPASRGANVAGIVNAHLFGNAAQVAAGDAASAPTTSLRLVLAGTLAGPDPEQGWAIIGETAQNAKVYATGTNVPGGARLKAVYADRAILDRNGKLESLPLPRLAGGTGPVPVSYAPRPTPQQPASLADSVRQLVEQDPAAVSEIIRPQPVFAGGQQKGYRVYPGRNRAQFARLGLMPGDLVTAVNGAPLDDPSQSLESLRSVGTGSPVMLTVERNGQVQQITVDPTQVMSELPEVNTAGAAPDEGAEE
jgi:general secretion pathway protein C